MKRILIKCSGALLAAHFILYLLLNNSIVGSPRFIPLSGQREVNLYGLGVVLAYGVILWIYLKKYDWEDPEVSLMELASLGVLAELCAEAIFQTVRLFAHSDPSEPAHVFNYAVSLLAMTLLAAIVSLYIAGRLKRNWIILVVCVFLWIGFGLAWQYFQFSSRV
jgi:hypothetical protein